MTQLHGIHRGIDTLRPANDVDIVLHVETCGVAAETARALESLGYEFVPSIDERNKTAHRFRRAESTVDLVTSGPDIVDVLGRSLSPGRVRHRPSSSPCTSRQVGGSSSVNGTGKLIS
jgi:hypothetical protein